MRSLCGAVSIALVLKFLIISSSFILLHRASSRPPEMSPRHRFGLLGLGFLHHAVYQPRCRGLFTTFPLLSTCCYSKSDWTLRYKQDESALRFTTQGGVRRQRGVFLFPDRASRLTTSFSSGISEKSSVQRYLLRLQLIKFHTACL